MAVATTSSSSSSSTRLRNLVPVGTVAAENNEPPMAPSLLPFLLLQLLLRKKDQFDELKFIAKTEDVIGSLSSFELEKQEVVENADGEKNKSRKRKRKERRKKSKKAMMEYVNVEDISMRDERDNGDIENAIFQYEDNIFERTNSDLSKAKLGYVIVSDNGAVICIKILGKTYGTTRIPLSGSLHLKYKSTEIAEVNNLVGRRFKLSAIPRAVNIEIQKRSEEIDSTLAAKYSSAVCPIRCIELIITKKFGRQFSFSSQESIDVFSPAIEGRYVLYTQNGPIARQVLEYYCEEGIVPAINYPFVGFRSFLSFKASKKLATKLFEVKGREFPLFGVDQLTCSKILNETKTLLALVAENPIIMKFKVGEKFDNWTGWDIYDPKIENSDDLYEEYVVAYGFDDDKNLDNSKVKYWLIWSCRASTWGKNGCACILRCKKTNKVLEALRPILKEDWKPNLNSLEF